MYFSISIDIFHLAKDIPLSKVNPTFVEASP